MKHPWRIRLIVLAVFLLAGILLGRCAAQTLLTSF